MARNHLINGKLPLPVGIPHGTGLTLAQPRMLSGLGEIMNQGRVP